MPTTDFEAIQKLSRDMRDASKLLGRREARYLVDLYYAIQDFRIQAGGQIRAAGEDQEPNRVVGWVFESMRMLEENVKKALGTFAAEYTVGQWMQNVTGIGPVISAGLLAHLDVRGCKTAGHFWRFAGLDPSMVWEKKQKRPWNAKLKTLCAFKLGESFVKVQNNDSDFYGKLYRKRKDQEIANNEVRKYAEQAAAMLEKKNFGKETEARKFYLDGRLPPAHLHARARRYAVKLFLSHLHHVMHSDYFGMDPPKPYAFEKCPGDHRHYIAVPDWPWDGGRSLRDLLIDEPDHATEPEEASEATSLD